MRLKCINNTRGIYFLYNGNKYIIYSEYYGVVAESTKIERIEEKNEVMIDFDICEWYGYWALQPIITKGIKAEETMYITDRKVVINYNTVKGTENSLKKYLKFELLDY